MEPSLISADTFIHALSAKHRVVLLGGMAIISHGLSRKTKDVDIWLDPMNTAAAWAAALKECLDVFSGVYLWSLADRCVLAHEDVAGEIEENGVLRVSGFDRDIDVFRRPNELGIESFEEVWQRSVKVLEGGVRLPDPLDLHISKANTGREHDWQDQLFLESLVKARFKERLPVCDLAEATTMLDRFLDPECLQYARTNPHPEVRALALKYLREFEAEGDPYSRDILAAGGWE
ncbi:MAG TPA: hypothetical protein DIT64_19000 [Verrucomicrobiales bacterium]|nr:hypothetical protein [Verrucomicrobiales bacterium]